MEPVSLSPEEVCYAKHMAKRLVVANWKMYQESPEKAKTFVQKLCRRSREFSGVDVVIAPSFTLLPTVAALCKGSSVRAMGQSLSRCADAPRTGEVSARMLALAGAAGVIVGHSERRAMGENDEAIAQQLAHADEAKLRMVLCVGETERNPSGSHVEFVAEQLRTALAAKPTASRLVVAYEPVWAIGKSAAEAMQPQDLEEMVIYIRKILAELIGRAAALRVPVLYGGSVEGSNAAELIEHGGVSGFLVGHASADIDSFLEILRATRQASR